MKKFASFVSLLAVLVIAMPAVAQTATQPNGWKVDTVTVSSGESALSTGITGILDMSKGSSALQVAVQPEQGWLVYGKNVTRGSIKLNFSGSIGHQMGEVWVGPYFTATLPLGEHVSLSTIQWPGFFMPGHEPGPWKTENDGVENPESMMLGYFGGVTLKAGPLILDYSWMNFLDDPWNQLPGVGLSKKFESKKWDVTIKGSVTRNVSKKKNMYYIGASWAPK